MIKWLGSFLKGGEKNMDHIPAPIERPIPASNINAERKLKSEGEGTYLDPQTVLFELSPDGKNPVRLVDCYNGIHIFGSTGAGKSSSAGYLIATSLLRIGAGGLVLTVKAEEVGWWIYLASVTGRTKDLIILKERGKAKFNFMDYAAPWGRAGSTTLVNLFKEIADAQKGANGRSANDEFFMNKFEQMLKSAIDALLIGKAKLGLRQIDEIIRTAPRSTQAVDAQVKLQDEITKAQAELPAKRQALDELLSEGADEKAINALRLVVAKLESRIKEAEAKKSVCYAVLLNALEKAESSDNPAHKDDARSAFLYFMESFAQEPDKQRAGYIGMWEGMSNKLLTGEINQLFNTETTFDLSQTFTEGKIIICALPTHELGQTGVIAQVLMKYMFQRAVEHRGKIKDDSRPVVLWADEAQEVFSRFDGQFQRTARGYRCITVYLSQTYSNYMEKLGGGEGARAAIDVLLANLKNRFFGTNSNHETNQWAQREIGTGRQLLFSENSGTSWNPFGGQILPSFNQGSGQSETFSHIIQDSAFTTLAPVTRPPHQPEFIVQRAGEPFSNGKTFMKTKFQGMQIPKDYVEPATPEPPGDWGDNQAPGDDGPSPAAALLMKMQRRGETPVSQPHTAKGDR